MAEILRPNTTPVGAGLIPKQGPRSLPIRVNFFTSNRHEVDLVILTAQQQLDPVQSIYVDNIGNNSPVTFTFNSVGHRVIVPPNGCAYLPIIVGESPKFVMESISTSEINVLINNFPMPAAVWTGSGGGIVDPGSGALIVSDLNIALAMRGSMLNVNNNLVGDNDATFVSRVGSRPIVGQKNTTGVTAVIAASPALRFFVEGIYLCLSANATCAAPTNLQIELRDGATTPFFRTSVLVPASALANGKYLSEFIPIKYAAPAVNTALNISLSAALNAGNLDYTVYGGQTAI